jgi:carbon-monoxide dehydrogenase large subunit
MSAAMDDVPEGPAGDAAVPPESVRRVEDARLLRGRGTFADDLQISGALYAHFVRSPHAHALLGLVDMSRVRTAPGVVAAFTGRDLAEGGVNPIPTAWFIDGMQLGERRALAIDRVRFEGEPVAVIIAESPEAGRDAAGAAIADYEPLPFVTDVEAAVAPGAPTVYDDAPGNTCFEWSAGSEEAVGAAFKSAHIVVARKIRNNRLIPTALEPRACAAIWTAGELRLHVASQNPHLHRFVIAGFVLDIPENRLHVVSGDVGGGFGSRIAIHPEEVVVAWVARHLDRPVRWTATREEAFLADCHGRDHVADAAMAFHADGRITGLRVRTLANLGANLSLYAAANPTWHYAAVLSGPYTIPAIHCSVRGVFSHTGPVDAYRGAGRPEAVHVVERLIDTGARVLGADPVVVRRRNLIQPSGQPHRTSTDAVYDTGNYVAPLDRALEIAGYDRLRTEQQRLRQQGRYMGVGVACYVDMSGHAPSRDLTAKGARAGQWESARVRVHPTGRVTVETGAHDQGQGHSTTFAQVAAAALGVAVADVAVAHGDTGSSPFGMGTHGSRGAAVGGSAVWLAARQVESKARALAAHLLGAEVSTLERWDGGYRVQGRAEEWRTFQEVALAAHKAQDLPEGMEPGLEATAQFDPPAWTWPFGTHVAVVDVDVETGEVAVRRYVAVDDCGNVINPAIVEGQIHGGIAQGIGQALWEEGRYGGDGRLETRSLRTYGVPRAGNLPSFETARLVTPSTSNPLGVKGVGEVGAVAAPAAVSNAVMDALAPFGVEHLDMPLTARKVWESIRASRRRAGEG